MLSGHSTTWFVIPAYNEARAIGETVRDLRTQFQNIVVVDDHSSDETRACALEAGAHVCRHPINLGQGAALQTGIDFALRQGAERIVTFDADGQHRVADALVMLETLDQNRCDVVLGSRFLGAAEGISNRKRAFLKAATWYTRVTTGLSVTDTHNGLRVFSRSAAQRLRITQNRMAHASEILHKISDLKLSFIEVPCTIIYTDYSKAKGQRMTGAFAILSDLFLRRLYQ